MQLTNECGVDSREYDGGAELFRLGIEPHHFASGCALCLAKLRPQGLVSLDAERQGTLVTKPFVWPEGHALYLNVAASWGEVRPQCLFLWRLQFPSFARWHIRTPQGV